jgi:hypothetical protein
MVARPTAVALESACREIRRTKTFPPSIAELLTVLREREEWWWHRRDMIVALRDHLENPRQLLAPDDGEPEDDE